MQRWAAEQRFPQAPQFELSVPSWTSQPLLATRSQSAQPLAQAPITQAPPVQTVEAWGRAPQVRPQAPQFSGSVSVLAQKLVQHV